MLAEVGDCRVSLHNDPAIFRKSLENENRLCLVSFTSAEYDELPEEVKTEVQAFAEVDVARLTKLLVAMGLTPEASEQCAKSIYAAVAGAQLVVIRRSDIALLDALIDGYRSAGLLPA